MGIPGYPEFVKTMLPEEVPAAELAMAEGMSVPKLRPAATAT
jgi:hypothetical protein